LTTENPRVVRLTRGKLTKLNFGVSIGRVVRIDLNSSAFTGRTVDPSPRLRDGLGRLISGLGEETSILKLTYVDRGEGKSLARKRLRVIEKIVASRWKAEYSRRKLNIETRIVKGR